MKYTNLQVGRIVAATAVLAFHATFYGNHYLQVSNVLGGFTSSYLFRTTIVFLFALSGFILAHCLQGASLTSFVKYRLLRLFPAYWFAMCVVLAVRWAIGAQLDYSARQSWYAWVLWPAGQRRVGYVVGIEWTLVYELFLSMAIVPLAALGRRRGLGIGVTAWLVACLANTVFGPGGEIPWFPRKHEIALSIVNVPFLLGVLTYLTHRHWAHRRSLLFVALAIFVAGRPFVEHANHWSYIFQSVAAAIAVGYLAVNRQVSANNVLVRGGDYAYGVYLAHVPVMMAVYSLITHYTTIAPSQSLVLLVGVTALGVGILYGKTEWACYRQVRRYLTRKPVVESKVLPLPSRGSHAPLRRAA